MRIPKTTGWGAALAVIAAAISGVSVFLNGRLVNGVFDDPTLLAAVRNGAVGVALTVLAVGTGGAAAWRGIRRRDVLALVVVGVLGGGIPFALFFTGLAESTSPAAAVIHKTLFLWVALLALPLLGERIGGRQVTVLALLLGGTIVLAPAGSIAAGVGEAMILGATLLWAVETILVRRLLQTDMPSVVAAAARMTIGSLTLFGLVAAGGGLAGLASYGAEHWLAILVTGTLLTAYVATWYGALVRAPATLVAGVLVGGAVVTTALQTWASGSLPAAPAIAGNGLLLAGSLGAIVALRAVSRPRVAPAPAASGAGLP